jgi:hypothetical protein
MGRVSRRTLPRCQYSQDLNGDQKVSDFHDFLWIMLGVSVAWWWFKKLIGWE